MSDRELLELAAKAAGYTGLYWSMLRQCFFEKNGIYWNPLEDDGDALRLAVKLNITIQPDPQVAEVTTCYYFGGVGYNMTEPWGPMTDGSQDDPYAATRRVIVRSAADIGRRMP